MAKASRRVIQLSIDGVEIKIFDKISEAAIQTGTNCGSIVNCCRGKNNTANGFIWKYDNSKYVLKSDPMDKLLDFLK